MTSFLSKLSPREAQNLNPLVLAYVGDAVQSLYVRRQLALQHDCKAAELHRLASSTVNAASQAAHAEALFCSLTEEEQSIFLRGRNAKTHHKAKNQSGSDYRKATGLEAVFGYLYLTGNEARLLELLAACDAAC